MPLVQPYNAAVNTMALFGLVAHMNGEINAATPQLECYFYENFERITSSRNLNPYAMDLIVGHAAIEVRCKILDLSVRMPDVYGHLGEQLLEAVITNQLPN